MLIARRLGLNSVFPQSRPCRKAGASDTASTAHQYKLDNASVDSSHLKETNAYKQSVADALQRFAETTDGPAATDHQAVLFLLTQYGLKPRAEQNTRPTNLNVGKKNGRKQSAAVFLEKITDQAPVRQKQIHAALAGMRDDKAWLWPHSDLKKFIARPDPPTENGEIVLKNARQASPNARLAEGEEFYAVDPTSYKIVALGRDRDVPAPQLNTPQVMKRHIQEHQAEKGRVFYAISATISSKFMTKWKKRKIAGFIFIGPDEDRAREIQIFVHQRYRHRGIATEAYKEIIKTVKKDYPDTKTLVSVIEALNVASRAMARKTGFKLQEVTIDPVAQQWQLARRRGNPCEVNATYTYDLKGE